VYLFTSVLFSVCDNDLFVFHTAGGLQQPQPTMLQQSYSAAYPGSYQAKYSSVTDNNYVYTEELFIGGLFKVTTKNWLDTKVCHQAKLLSQGVDTQLSRCAFRLSHGKI